MGRRFHHGLPSVECAKLIRFHGFLGMFRRTYTGSWRILNCLITSVWTRLAKDFKTRWVWGIKLISLWGRPRRVTKISNVKNATNISKQAAVVVVRTAYDRNETSPEHSFYPLCFCFHSAKRDTRNIKYNGNPAIASLNGMLLFNAILWYCSPQHF